jgi:hypothetical protein
MIITEAIRLNQSESIKVFIEYKIHEPDTKSYLSLLPSIRQQMEHLGATDYMVYSGVGQPGLFVEECRVSDIGAFQRLKEARLQTELAAFQELHQYIIGGSAKCHIWAFRALKDGCI